MAFNTKNNDLIYLIMLYEDTYCNIRNVDILDKLCLIVFCYIKLQSTDRMNVLHRLSPEMLKQLTRYIIP